MALKRSVLDRSELYCPAPRISGQASYGGVPMEIYTLAALVFGTLLGATLIAMIVLKAMIGIAPKWMFLIPLISTALFVLPTIKATNRRRDILVILRESRLLEKRESRKRTS